MKRFSIIICLLLGLSLSFWFCQRRLFKNIDISGRLVNYFTKEPITENMTLMGDDATSAKEVQMRTQTIATGKSDENGHFNFKTKASRRNSYYLFVRYGEPTTDNTYFQQYSFSVNENSKTELGDVLIGHHFFTCNVKIIATSNYSIAVGSTICKPGSTTQMKYTRKYSSEEFKDNKKMFIIGYTLFDNATTTYSSVSIPIGTYDTLSTTIQY